MYTEFFHLKEKPFNLTPSSRFLYLGECHKEALALLTYGVMERKGFILLTGEVGTGKTTMIQALLRNLDKSVQYVYVSNPLLSPMDFLDYLSASAFKEKSHFKSKTDFLLRFEAFLRDSFQNQKNFVLIIDEAQKLSFELLEEIRLLSNMEIGDEGLINIFLAGQPELNEKLCEPRCRPLLQRISMRYHIPPLDLEATKAYVRTRLKVAGAENGQDIFSDRTIEAIHEYSLGHPRMINILADNALLLGYSEGERRITSDMVRQCYDDLQLDGSLKESAENTHVRAAVKAAKANKSRHKWKWAIVLCIVMVATGIFIGRLAWKRDILGDETHVAVQTEGSEQETQGFLKPQKQPAAEMPVQTETDESSDLASEKMEKEQEAEPPPAEPEPIRSEEAQIIALLEVWRKAWEEKRVKDYIAHYHPAFKAGDKDLTAWKHHKERLNNRYRTISVEISHLKAKVQGDEAWAYFEQRYRSDSYVADGYKMIEFKKKDGYWLIFRERYFDEIPDNWPT
jgi:general secretion pathway protein A